MLNMLAKEIRRINEAHGFECPSRITSPQEATFAMEKLMLIVTEVAEAAEAVRHDNFENLKEELADVVIRTLDLACALGVDIETEIAKKMEQNRSRPYRHGKRL